MIVQPSLTSIRVFTRDDFVYTRSEDDFEVGVIIHAKGKTYSKPTFDTAGCNTYFIFRKRRFYLHEYESSNQILVPQWLLEWKQTHGID